MPTLTNSAEGGTAGTTVTPANSGGASGNAFDAVNIATGASITFDNSQSMHGNLAYKFTQGATAALTDLEWTTSLGSWNQAWFRAYVYVASLPAQTMLLKVFAGTELAIQTTQHLKWFPAGGVSQDPTVHAINLNQWFRIEGYVLAGASAGAVELKLFLGDNVDGSVPDEVQTFTGINTGSGPFTLASFGGNITASTGTFWLDDVAWSTAGYIGPALSQTTSFPPAALGVKAEININGQWADISAFLYDRGHITISHGRPDESGAIQTASCTFQLNNRDQRFSPQNTAGPYYPFLSRNTQVRISVQAVSVLGTIYSGYRFWGEIPSWTPRWDISQHDLYVLVTASGIWRRLAQNTNNAGSALFRYWTKGGGPGDNPVAVWPCEDSSAATQIASALSGGNPMTWGATKPNLAADTSIPGADAFLQVSGSQLTGIVSANSVTSSPVLFTTPGSFTWTAPADVTSVKAECWGGGGGSGGHSSAVGCAGGGGGEYAAEATLAVTGGNSYTAVVGTGGKGQGSSGSTNGGDSTFAGNSVTVRAHGGGRGLDVILGPGGSGSTNTTHFSGGIGGHGNNAGGGGGGAGSGGTAAAGNNGGDSPGTTGGAGATAVAGGGPGGRGGNKFAYGNMPGSGPGGGGGGAGVAITAVGGNGYAGQVKLTYTTALTPASNIFTFLLDVPSGGGTNGAIEMQFLTAGTVAKVNVVYNTAGTITVNYLNSGGTTLATHTSAKVFKGVPAMIRIELLNSGANLSASDWYAVPGDVGWTNIGNTTLTTASCGTVSTANVNPGGTETQPVGVGFIAVAYTHPADAGLFGALNAWQAEHALDRVLRLCLEEGVPTNSFAAGASPALPQYDNAISFNQLAGWWTFSSASVGGTDSSAGGNPATLTSVTFPIDGPPVYNGESLGNQSAQFNGTSSVAVTTLVLPGLGALTVHFWMNISGFTQAAGTFPQMIASSDSSSTSSHKGWEIFLDASTLRIGGNFGTGTGFTQVWSTPAVEPGWNHYAFTYDGTTARSYVNGQQVASSTAFSGLIPNDTGGVTMGASVATPRSNWFAGKLAEVAVYERALSATEIATQYLYNSGASLGAQTDEPVTTLLQECEDVDRGLLHEMRGSFGLTYRPRVSLFFQAPGCTLDYAASQIGLPVPQPEADDQLTHNDITLARVNGSAATAVLASGALSVQPPPNGVGPYALAETFNFFADYQLLPAADFLLSLGTVSDFRWPVITPAELERASMAGAVFATLPGLDEGDHVQVINPPAWVIASGNADQLVFGFTEIMSIKRWAISLNTVPESPYETSQPTW